MRFVCNRGALADVLSLLLDVVPSRPPKPIFQNIKIKGNENGTLTLSATDLEIGLSYTFPVEELSHPDVVLLPASKLTGLIRDDWAPTVTFSIQDYRAEITSENGTFHLAGSSAEDFPDIGVMPKEDLVEISGEDLVDAVQKTAFATAKSDTRYALNGILLSIAENTVDFVSSDTHRLSLSHKSSRTSVNNAEAIVITKGMLSLARMAEGEETVRLHLSKSELLAQTSKGTLVSRLVDGHFPRYREVMPDTLEKSVTVNRELLTKTLRLNGQVTNEETRSITLITTPDSLLISASGSETADGKTEIPAEVVGDSVQVSFNYIYILDVLKVIEDQTIVILMQDEQTPVRINAGDFSHIVMPIRPLT